MLLFFSGRTASCCFSKYALLFVTFLAISLKSNGQQTPQFSQFIQNPFVINPAITGAEEYSEINVTHRSQWTNFEGAPTTSSLTFNTPIRNLRNKSLLHRDPNRKQGLGLIAYNDEAGPIEINLFAASYAYHLKVSRKWFVSAGTFIGASQFNFDDSNVVLIDNQNDILIQDISKTNFDLSFGVYAYSNDLFVGVSANQILNSGIEDDTSLERTGTFVRNYNFLLGSRIPVQNNFNIVPFVLAKATINAPVQFEAGAKAEYDGKLWAGFSYRNQDALVGFLGFKIWKRFIFNYSYDLSTNAFNSNQDGTHEIIVGYRFSLDNKSCACPTNSL